ncbi:hypothetical protein SESBI_30699 [Sesbania bispinosa]|nr:hypothetical protein SESBI_30699 [Sesbania bispinosa]
MGDLLPFPRAWGAFIIAYVLPVLHDTTLLLDRAKLLYGIMKGMELMWALSTPRKWRISYEIFARQNALSNRQDLIYQNLKSGQFALIRMLIDMPQEALADLMGLKDLPEFLAVGQSSGAQNIVGDDEPANT